MDLLKNKVVWITGGARGIGAFLSIQFLKNGSRVIATGTKDSGYYLGKQSSDLLFNDLNFSYFKCDVKDVGSIRKLYSDIISKYSRIDILINNAGIGLFKPFHETSYEEFDSIIDVNLKGAFNCIKVVIPDMITNKSGTIVNISSVAALDNFANCSIYNMSKSGLLSLSRSLRNEYRSLGIKIIDVLPGATNTEIWDEKSRNNLSEKLMHPDNVAKVIVDSVHNSLQGNTLVEEIIIRPIHGNI